MLKRDQFINFLKKTDKNAIPSATHTIPIPKNSIEAGKTKKKQRIWRQSQKVSVGLPKMFAVSVVSKLEKLQISQLKYLENQVENNNNLLSTQ